MQLLNSVKLHARCFLLWCNCSLIYKFTLFLIFASLFYFQGIVAFTYDDQIASRMEKQQTSVASDSKGVINEVLEVCNWFHVKPFERRVFIDSLSRPRCTSPPAIFSAWCKLFLCILSCFAHLCYLQGLTGLLQSPIKGAEKHGLPGVLSGESMWMNCFDLLMILRW